MPIAWHQVNAAIFPRRRSSRQLAQFAAASPAPSPADEDALPVAASVARHPIGLRGRQLRDAFASLDAHDASAMLRQPCHMFRTPPLFVKGLLRHAMQFALTHILQASAQSREAERAWKLWLLLPRMLLHRPAGAQRLLNPSCGSASTASPTGTGPASFKNPPRRHPTPNAAPRPESAARADLAVHLAHLGELSAARQKHSLRPRSHPPAFEAATHPHQYALSTRAGSEALVHSLQVACDGDPSLTVLSVDGVGASDLVSRQAMLTALRDTPNANAMLPFVRFFLRFAV